MRTIERMIDVAFISLFVAVAIFVVTMVVKGEVYASFTGLG